MTSWERPTWLVRIRRSLQSAPVGAGVLNVDGCVLTCAHVVSEGQGARPTEPVYVEFQFAVSHEPIPATVAEGGGFNIHAYICGLNEMVSANREKLKSLGWQRKQIVFERYD